jgi:hypothetical protein
LENQPESSGPGGADPDEVKKLTLQLSEKDKVIEQISQKMQTDMMKTMELHSQMGQLQ